MLGRSPDPSESPIRLGISLSGMGLLLRGNKPPNAQLYPEMMKDEQEQDNATQWTKEPAGASI